jgi:hypothetical protein
MHLQGPFHHVSEVQISNSMFLRGNVQQEVMSRPKYIAINYRMCTSRGMMQCHDMCCTICDLKKHESSGAHCDSIVKSINSE